MPTTDYALVPYPSGTDADNVPADLGALADFIDTKLVLTATSSSDRDSKYSGIPDGALVINTSDGTTWARAGGAWKTLWAPTGAWVNCSQAATNSGPVQVRSYTVGGKKKCTIRGQVGLTAGGDFSAAVMGGTGVFFTIPASHLPAAGYGDTLMASATQSLQGSAFSPNVRAQIDTSSGDVACFGNQDPSTGVFKGTPWVNFSGIEYWIED